jgi:sugar phosphate isomerase/epimerase
VKLTRRTALALAAAPFVPAASRTPIRLGGPIFLNSDDPVALAKEHRRLGYSAAYCPKASIDDMNRVRAIEKAFAAENVVISEVGVWVNMLDPDAAKRRENIAKVTRGLALADAVGARCCVDIAGSYNPKVWYGPDPKNFSREFFEATVANCRHLIDEVKPKRTRFTVEMMGWAWPEGPDQYLELIKAVDRPQFGVHVDVCNAINSPQRYYTSSAVIRDIFNKLGRHIVSCHAKDLDWIPEMNVHFVEVIPGRGSIDYTTYLTAVSQLPVDAPLMLEHLKNAQEYDEARNYILKKGAEAGVSFA